MSLSSLSRSFVGARLVPVVLVCLLLAADTSPARAQGRATGKFMNEAVIRVTNVANGAKFNNFGYIDGVSILGGWLNNGASLSFSTPLTAGTDYLLLAGGDGDTQAVDLEVVDARGNVLAADRRGTPDAVLTFSPQVNGVYTLRITLFKSRNNFPCVCVTTILKKNGWNVPVNNLDKATAKVMKALEVADQTAQRLNQRVDLRRAQNQWAFYGGVLRQGTSMGMTNLSLGFGERLFVGAGDDFANVINLDLENAANQAIKQDFKNDAVSVLSWSANGGLHGLRVHNVQARSPAVVLMAVLDIYDPAPGR